MSQLIPAIGFGLITASILAIAAVGFTLQFSVTNILNLAYGDIMTACAFAAYVANQAGVNIWICLVIASLFGAVFSLLLNRLVYFQFVRRGTRLFGMIIVTIAMSLIIQNVLLAIFRPTFFSYHASQGPSYNFGSMVFTASQLAIIGIAALAMLGVHLLSTAVLGGIGQPYGAMLGAITIGLASEVAASVINPSYKDVVAFGILILVLLVRPQGILSEVAAAKEVAA